MIARHLADGAWAERHARRHLEHRGMKLVERNYTSPHGEIDLVMREGDTLVFVEVRMRADTRFGHPAETIDAAKQRRLRRTAESYLQRQFRSPPNCRFDVVTIVGDRRQPETRWFRDAFS